jgi:hypothetical protein
MIIILELSSDIKKQMMLKIQKQLIEGGGRGVVVVAWR